MRHYHFAALPLLAAALSHTGTPTSAHTRTGTTTPVPTRTGTRTATAFALGYIHTIAGDGDYGGSAYDVSGLPATSTRLSGPTSVCVDAAGVLTIADAGCARSRRTRVSPPSSSAAAQPA